MFWEQKIKSNLKLQIKRQQLIQFNTGAKISSELPELIYFQISNGFWIITISLPKGWTGISSKSCLPFSTCPLTAINMQST